jgi:hypothetical protein
MTNPKIVDVYDSIGDTSISNMVYAQSSKPSPQKSDYDRGFITRHFVQRINTLTIQEVSNENFNSVSNSLYIKVGLKWKITGIQKSKVSGKVVVQEGVENFNRQSVMAASQTMSGLSNAISNHLEFWQGH